MRVGLIGGVSSSFVTLKKLIEHGFNVSAVFGYKPSEGMVVSMYCDFEKYALDNGLKFYAFTKINDHSSQVREAKLDVIFVVGISQLISNEIINSARLGCIGFHPTALPKGRGRAPLAWMVKNSENGAASFFQITNVADAGPIFVQEGFKVSEEDDVSSVESRLLEAMDVALDRWLPKLKSGQWNPINQNDYEATEYGLRKPEDGLIDWSNSANSILSLIRASSYPHPGAFSYSGLEKIVVNKARLELSFKIEGCVGRILKVKEGELLIQTGKGLIWISSLQIQGGLPKVGERLGYMSEVEINKLKRELNDIKKYIGMLDE